MSDDPTVQTTDLADMDTEAYGSGGVYGGLTAWAFGPEVAQAHELAAERARALAEAEHGRRLAQVQLDADEDAAVTAHRAEMRRYARLRARGVAWQHMVTPVAIGAIAGELATLLAMFGWRVFS